MTRFGWQAHFVDDPVRLTTTLRIWRVAGDRIAILTGDVSVVEHDHAFEVDAGVGLVLPHDAKAAIEFALNPPAHLAEIRRLEEALAIERRRVDFTLVGANNFHAFEQEPS